MVEAREQVREISAKWVQNESEGRSHDVLPYASGSTQRRNFSIETVLLTGMDYVSITAPGAHLNSCPLLLLAKSLRDVFIHRFAVPNS
ncbi:MAG: hypothetical protein LZF86_190598 [Nitrospira sp.]|nr:MAG: hypothetical protein LZF86_190598 [Nitrospira sp.]